MLDKKGNLNWLETYTKQVGKEERIESNILFQAVAAGDMC